MIPFCILERAFLFPLRIDASEFQLCSYTTQSVDFQCLTGHPSVTARRRVSLDDAVNESILPLNPAPKFYVIKAIFQGLKVYCLCKNKTFTIQRDVCSKEL